MCGIFISVEECRDCQHLSDQSSLETRSKTCMELGKRAIQAAQALSVRGPDHKNEHSRCSDGLRWTYAFHRLMVVNQSHDADQPIVYLEAAQVGDTSDKRYLLMCNGEIYNYKQLNTDLKLGLSNTDSDCKVILQLYLRFGIEKTLALISGEFAFVLIDEYEHNIIVARDPIGVRPLYVGFSSETPSCNTTEDSKASKTLKVPKTSKKKQVPLERLAFSSEMKSLHELKYPNIEQFSPGEYAVYNYQSDVVAPGMSTLSSIDKNTAAKVPSRRKTIVHQLQKAYFSLEDFKPLPDAKTESERRVVETKLRDALTFAVEEMFDASRPIGSLLSGGIDSTLIAVLLCRTARRRGCFDKVNFFSIGLRDSEDVFFAKHVAKALHIPEKQHHVVEFTVEKGIAAIPDVISRLSSFDITTVRASTPQYLLAKYIATKTDVRVVFSGEASDEHQNGYRYSKNAPNAMSLFEDSKRLMKELHYFDVLRTDRTMSGFGLEVRVPFLHPRVIYAAMTLPLNMRLWEMVDIPVLSQKTGRVTIMRCQLGKLALRRAFLRDGKGESYLPMFLLMRDKTALSDGVSSQQTSWYKSIQTMLDRLISDDQLKKTSDSLVCETIHHLVPKTKEALWYRQLYEKAYGVVTCIQESPIPKFWMPKWQSDKIMSLCDPSATIL